jgi:hypothetical protein
VIGAAIGFLQLSQDRVEVERGRLLTRREGHKRFDLLGDDGPPTGRGARIAALDK